MEDDSPDDDILYSINPDVSNTDSDEVENDGVNGESDPPCESADDECISTNNKHHEDWSEKLLKSNLPFYDSILKLSPDFESKLPRNATPTDFFQLYFTPELVSYIVDQSNLYRIQTNNTKQSPMTDVDLNCLLEFLFYISVVPVPNKRDYWSSFSRQSIIADAIALDRIMYLLSILHFHDNSIEIDKVEKVQPILEYFNKRCRQTVEPENNLSIDEQMIPYKGTTAPTSYRQYMPKKPTKRVFKVWTRCGVSAFMCEMILYCDVTKFVSSRPPLTDSSLKRTSRNAAATTGPTNNSTINTHRETLLKDYGSSGMAVLDLTKNAPAGSSIFIDNYFSSTKLMKKLIELGYRVTCNYIMT